MLETGLRKQNWEPEKNKLEEKGGPSQFYQAGQYCRNWGFLPEEIFEDL